MDNLFHNIFLYLGHMLIMGTINLLMLKLQHMLEVPLSQHTVPRVFVHPLLQAALLMVGAFLYLHHLTHRPTVNDGAAKVPKYLLSGALLP